EIMGEVTGRTGEAEQKHWHQQYRDQQSTQIFTESNHGDTDPFTETPVATPLGLINKSARIFVTTESIIETASETAACTGSLSSMPPSSVSKEAGWHPTMNTRRISPPSDRARRSTRHGSSKCGSMLGGD